MNPRNAQPGQSAASGGCRPALAEPPQTGFCTASVVRLNSAQLFGQANEVHIEHGEAVYRLRITSLGKLILTK